MREGVSAKDAGEPPLCECHGVPMYWHKRTDRLAGGLWRCREARKPLDAARWAGYWDERMPLTVRAPRALKDRRAKALARRAERHARRQEET